MNRAAARASLAALAALPLAMGCNAPAARDGESGWSAQAAEPARAVALADDFDAGLCTERCPRAIWYFRQLVDGQVSVVADPRGRGGVFQAAAGPSRGRIAKAALVARLPHLGAGRRIAVSFDVMVPAGTPLNSVHLLDVECARCGTSGNPGIRLYLRHGRIRIDRDKIGIEHAWTNDRAPQLQAGRWHRIDAVIDLASDDRGGAAVRLDGREVLRRARPHHAGIARRGHRPIATWRHRQQQPGPRHRLFR